MTDDYSLITSFAERDKVSQLEERFAEVEGADAKTAMLHMVASQMGMPFKTIERKYYAWRSGGRDAIADKRRISRGAKDNPFYRIFKTYAERNLNESKDAWRDMMKDFRNDKVFAFGTWRDIWKEEFRFEAVPPVCPSNWTPKGATYQNLMRLYSRDPARAMSLAWSRQGQFASLKHALPVVRSRVGLKPGQVYQADDVWHNINVFSSGIKGLFQPLEFAFYDIASAFKPESLMKPRALTIDPKTGKETRDNLKEFQFRLALAHLVCCTGFHKDGVRFVLEHGTTAIRANVQRRIASIPVFGKLIRFEASGKKNEPAHKGLFIGSPGGNPRMKSLCEGAHNILHNATAALPGSRGRDAAHMHESTGALVKYAEKMLQQANEIDPVLAQLLQLPVLDYRTYQQYFYKIEDSVMDRREHDLEGWQENEELCYFDEGKNAWESVGELANKSPEAAAIIIAKCQGNPKLLKMCKMSRRQVWRKGLKDLVRLPLIEMPAFLDPRDVKEETVRPDGTIVFKDAVYYPGEKKIYLARYTDRNGLPHMLAPGQKVKFYWNPIGELAKHIWIAADDEEHSVLGMAPALKTARWTDPESIKVAAGQQMAQIAALMSDTRARHAEDAAMLEAKKKINKLILDAAKTGELKLGNEELRMKNEELEDEDPIQFLERMNSMAAH